MCLIVVKPADKSIAESILKEAFFKNSNGWGIMSLEEGIPMAIRRPPISKNVNECWEEFIKIYREHYQEKEIAVHFRLATSGYIDEDNCHPYPITEGVWMMHNGVILGIPEPDKTKSDTWHLGDLLAPMIDAGMIRTEKFRILVESLIGAGNKLVMLDKDGFVFFNKDEGTTYQDCWYSNTYAWTNPDRKTSFVSGHWDAKNQVWVPYNGKPTESKYWKADKEANKIWSDSAYFQETKFPISKHVFLASGEQISLEDEVVEPTTEQSEDSETYEVVNYDAGVESDEEAQKILERLDALAIQDETKCQTVSIPESLLEWSTLNLQEIYDIALEEPEMVADALFNALEKIS